MTIEEKYPLALKRGTVLAGIYIIDSVLGQGGFGITYKAVDHERGIFVAIKEYFPDTLAYREKSMVISYTGERSTTFEYGKSTFLEEAKTLAQFIGNENIVRIYTYFEENGTAYFVMEYIEGVSFDKYLKMSGGKIGIQQAETLLLPIMDALAAVHSKGIVHRDVTPDNIYICSDGTVKLLDFGAARYSLGDKSRSLDVILKHGFAPKEQYMRRGKQGPFTDVYSLGVTFYFAITGVKPPDAVERLDFDQLEWPRALGADITINQEEAILKAMAIQPQDRFQSMLDFKQALLEETCEETKSGSKQEYESENKQKIKLEPKTHLDPKPQLEPEFKPEPEFQPEPELQLEPEPKPETSHISEPESKPEPDNKLESDQEQTVLVRHKQLSEPQLKKLEEDDKFIKSSKEIESVLEDGKANNNKKKKVILFISAAVLLIVGIIIVAVISGKAKDEEQKIIQLIWPKGYYKVVKIKNYGEDIYAQIGCDSFFEKLEEKGIYYGTMIEEQFLGCGMIINNSATVKTSLLEGHIFGRILFFWSNNDLIRSDNNEYYYFLFGNKLILLEIGGGQVFYLNKMTDYEAEKYAKQTYEEYIKAASEIMGISDKDINHDLLADENDDLNGDGVIDQTDFELYSCAVERMQEYIDNNYEGFKDYNWDGLLTIDDTIIEIVEEYKNFKALEPYDVNIDGVIDENDDMNKDGVIDEYDFELYSRVQAINLNVLGDLNEDGVIDIWDGIEYLILLDKLEEISESTPTPTAEPTPTSTVEPTPTPTAEATPTPSPIPMPKVGEIIEFGSYEQDNELSNGKEPIEWIVLSVDKDSGEALLLSKYGLSCQPYDDYFDLLERFPDGEGDVKWDSVKITWETSTIRKWLNDDFYNTAFSENEKKCIIKTKLENVDNPEYGTKGGKSTKDNVFLLSVSDINNTVYGFNSKYRKSDIMRRCTPTKYAIWEGIAYYEGDDAEWLNVNGEPTCCWWLRSPGENQRSAISISFSGYVSTDGDEVNYAVYTARPAIYVKVK